MELSPLQRRIRDFYFKEALTAPRTASHVHKPGLVPDQRLFSMADLRRRIEFVDHRVLQQHLAQGATSRVRSAGGCTARRLHDERR